MRVFISPSCIGANLLNSGAMTLGAMNCTNSMKAIATSQTYSHHNSPMPAINQSTANRIGRPSAVPTAACFARSPKNMATVILLKPKRLSMPKVRYRSKGSSMTERITVRIATNATPRKIPEEKMEAARLSMACRPPPNVRTSRTAASNTSAFMLRRVFALL